MPLQAVLDEATFTGLDDSLKTIYRQNEADSNYYIDLAPDEAGKVAFNLNAEVERLRKHSETVLKEKKEMAGKYKAYESLGKTPEEILEALNSNQPEEVQKLIEKHNAEREAILKSHTDKAKAYEEQLMRTLVQNEISKLRADFDLNETADFVLREFIRPELDDDGQIKIRVYNEDGKPAYGANGDVKPEEFVKGLKEHKKFLAMFNSPNGGGSGDPRRHQPGNNSSVMRREDFGKLSPQDQMAFSLKGGKLED